MKVLIISDIHGDLNKLNKILADNTDVDKKIFLGDFQVNKSKQIELSKIFDYVVMGNCDYPQISKIEQIIELDGIKILLTHGHIYETFSKKIDFDNLFKSVKNKNIKLILHGHDHIAIKTVCNGIIRFNPGSPTFPRGGTNSSYGLLEIKNGKIISLKHIII